MQRACLLRLPMGHAVVCGGGAAACFKEALHLPCLWWPLGLQGEQRQSEGHARGHWKDSDVPDI